VLWAAEDECFGRRDEGASERQSEEERQRQSARSPESASVAEASAGGSNFVRGDHTRIGDDCVVSQVGLIQGSSPRWISVSRP
jgi:hypothetical protein